MYGSLQIEILDLIIRMQEIAWLVGHEWNTLCPIRLTEQEHCGVTAWHRSWTVRSRRMQALHDAVRLWLTRRATCMLSSSSSTNLNPIPYIESMQPSVSCETRPWFSPNFQRYQAFDLLFHFRSRGYCNRHVNGMRPMTVSVANWDGSVKGYGKADKRELAQGRSSSSNSRPVVG
jgi:hypothetical protein